MHDRPQSLEHFMIIGRPAQLAGKDCAAYGVLHATDGALDLWRVFPGRC